MDRRLQDILFNEFSNRYDRDIIYVIKGFFKGEDVKDIYQELMVHFYQLIGRLYESDSNLFSTRSWVRTIAENFCKSELRKRNGKRKVQLVYDDISVNNSRHIEDFDFETSSDKDLNVAIKDFLKNLTKREALILKMKYYYGKPSTYISRKMNEAHVNVCIQRIKERLIRRTGIEDLEAFVSRYNTFL
ncbi:MAG: sigma-70 family RNA polymerase sigma factor [Crocinitomicaceae bacterium]|jgi:RNA polymerase sigma factor (sigma-70 family)